MNTDIQNIWEAYQEEGQLTNANASDDWSGGATAVDYDFCVNLEQQAKALETELKRIRDTLNRNGWETKLTDNILNGFSQFKQNSVLGRHQQ